MDNVIRTFPVNSPEWTALNTFAKDLTQKSSNMEFIVQDVMFDMGQNWMWTTIIAKRLDLPAHDVLASWQAINPREQKAIILGLSTEMANITRRLLSKQ